MVKTVIFDLGNVLIPFDFSRGYRGMAELSSIPMEEIRDRIRATDLVHRFESGWIEAEDFVQELSRVIGHPMDYQQFCTVWSSIFLPQPNFPDAMLEALHRRYRLVLLSNTNAIHYPMLRRTYPQLDVFDAYVLSHEVKAMKPDPRIYQAVLAEVKCAPQECFYTDDIAEYVEGARGFGIDAVQFQSREQIESELHARGVEW